MFDYIRDGNEIYRNSFAIIRSESNLERFPEDVAKVAVRMIHACGMTDIVNDLEYSSTAVEAGKKALIGGSLILCDSYMVAEGVTRKRLPKNNKVLYTLNDPEVPQLAKRLKYQVSSGFRILAFPYRRGNCGDWECPHSPI